ncbi:MAG: phosphotransferase [Bacteroidales bacterium]|jgi:aminoglycoside/choline kinase family phosphotransferase|nr:phosphotransferase [Bacteroidales bacterium]
MDVRTTVERAFQKWSGTAPETITRLPRSGSDRIYFRLHSRGEHVIGAFNPGREENDAFVGFTNHFRSKGLSVPEIYVYYPDEKVYFLEDLGDTNLFTWLAQRSDEERFNEETEALFLNIASDLVRIQTEGIKGLDLALCYPHRSFDRQSIVWDLNYYKYMFLKLIAAPFNETRLERDFEALTLFLLEAGQEYFLFRDFQTANIMIRDGKPWYIDYQGGRLGAPQYDIASLIYDAKAYIPENIRRKTLERHLDLFAAATGRSRSSLAKYSGAFTLVRLMQALGAFGYRGLHENKPTFTESIVPAVELMNDLLAGEQVEIDLPELKKASAAVPAQRKYRILAHYQNLLKINIESFSYVRGKTLTYDNGGGFVFDCRGLRNPATMPDLVDLTGNDHELAEFFGNDEEAIAFAGDCVSIIRNSLPMIRGKGVSEINIAFGCVGGRHRSVWCAGRVAAMLTAMPGVTVTLSHREL